MLFLPGIPMCFIAEWMCTKWGRRVPMWTGCIIVIAGSLIQMCSINKAMFMVCTYTHPFKV